MHLVSVSCKIPFPGTGGSGNWSTSLLKGLARAGHQVSHIVITGKHGPPEDTAVERAHAFQRSGVDIVKIPYLRETPPSTAGATGVGGWGFGLGARLEDLWPYEMATARSLNTVLQDLKPDCVLALGFNGTSMTHYWRESPRIGILQEGPHTNVATAWRYNPDIEPELSLRYAKYHWDNLWNFFRYRAGFLKLVAPLSAACFQGPNLAAWARRHGIAHARHVATPVPDSAASVRKEGCKIETNDDRFRILTIGHLHSTSNRAGLSTLFERIVPTLDREWGTDKYQLRVVGDNSQMPERFDRWREHPAVHFRGPVYPPDNEFIGCDVLLMPIPARSGARVRVITGFCFGCCVVSHVSAAEAGIPELVHGETGLLAKSGGGLARQIMRAARDPDLRRRLGANARHVYERHYSEDRAVTELETVIAEVTRRGTSARPMP